MLPLPKQTEERTTPMQEAPIDQAEMELLVTCQKILGMGGSNLAWTSERERMFKEPLIKLL